MILVHGQAWCDIFGTDRRLSEPVNLFSENGSGSGLQVSSRSIGLVFVSILKRSIVATNSSTVGKSNESSKQ